ncbi:espF repeat family protein [Escherichia coli ATCC 700728]|nr:espF repeat family protein [Escherichia coli ATCC 700728]
MAEHIPPAPNWPAPPPPVQNEQSRPLPDVAQRLMQHLAEHGIQPHLSARDYNIITYISSDLTVTGYLYRYLSDYI